jgi:hypothetical protein
MHDRPALIERTRVVGRLLEDVPGTVIGVDEYPGPTTSEIEAWRSGRSEAAKESVTV